tara:strand:- start:1401 stop:2342 length:942 start_codon:yes stop_codon:yes gene_type:complete
MSSDFIILFVIAILFLVVADAIITHFGENQESGLANPPKKTIVHQFTETNDDADVLTPRSACEAAGSVCSCYNSNSADSTQYVCEPCGPNFELDDNGNCTCKGTIYLSHQHHRDNVHQNYPYPTDYVYDISLEREPTETVSETMVGVSGVGGYRFEDFDDDEIDSPREYYRHYGCPKSEDDSDFQIKDTLENKLTTWNACRSACDGLWRPDDPWLGRCKESCGEEPTESEDSEAYQQCIEFNARGYCDIHVTGSNTFKCIEKPPICNNASPSCGQGINEGYWYTESRQLYVEPICNCPQGLNWDADCTFRPKG